MLTTVQLLGVPVTTSSEVLILEEIEKAIAEKRSLFVTTPNPEIVVEAQKNAEFKAVLSSADIALPDGTGLVLALQIKGIGVSRIRGREFFRQMLALAEKNKRSVFLFGASTEVNQRAIMKIKEHYPNLEIQGSSEAVSGSPDMIFVALGHPKQELWIAQNRNNFPQAILMAIGGTLDSFTGFVPQPPNMFARLGFEWLFRLLVQPQRWRRIINALIIFPWMVLKGS